MVIQVSKDFLNDSRLFTKRRCPWAMLAVTLTKLAHSWPILVYSKDSFWPILLKNSFSSIFGRFRGTSLNKNNELHSLSLPILIEFNQEPSFSTE